MASDAQAERLDLVFPIYLDVPMMVSFLAALQGGVAFEDERVKRSLSGMERERAIRGSARSGIPLLGQLLGFDISGRFGARDRGEEGEEIKAVRQHTAASLFNTLRHHLLTDRYVQTVADGGDLENLQTGQLVQVTGAFVGNPLQHVLAFFALAEPYMDLEQRVQDKIAERYPRSKRTGRSGQRAPTPQGMVDEQAVLAEIQAEVQQEFGLAMLRQMKADLDDARVHDTVIELESGLDVVLTMSSEFFTTDARERLRAGEFTVLGKVTRILGDGDQLNLARRTVLGAAESGLAEELLTGLDAMPGLALESGQRAVIESPAVQILPLAVFV